MVFPLCGMKSFHYLYTQIAGRQQQFQGQVNLRVAIAEQFFVDDCQERVLYGRPGLSYLVEEHHVSRNSWSWIFIGVCHILQVYLLTLYSS